MLLPLGKTALLGLLLLFHLQISAQFSENFTNSDLSSWAGTSEKFEVVDEVLTLNDPSNTSPAYLSQAVATLGETTWEFFVQFDFSPSNNNRIRYYLKSNNADLTTDLNGYYIQIGESGSDDGIDLYRQTGSTRTKIIDGVAATVASATNAFISVTVDDDGNWEVLADVGETGSLVSQGTVNDVDVLLGDFIGPACFYTSTNTNAIAFDDLLVDPIYADNDAPQVTSLEVVDIRTLQITFSENLVEPISTGFFTLDDGTAPSFVVFSEGSYILTFTEDFPTNEPLTLTINGVSDETGNVLNTSVGFIFSVLENRSVLINEIFPDPEPAVGLPVGEFVELWNRTDLPIDVSGWSISDPGKTAVIESGSIPANGFVIICPNAAVELWEDYGNVIGVPNFPSLNNASDVLTLNDQFFVPIDELAYSDTWYDDAAKKEGGYTLELIDADFPCQGNPTWTGSNAAAGGTPGAANSVNAVFTDEIRPTLLRAEVLGDSLLLYFSEQLDASSIEDINNYTIQPSLTVAGAAYAEDRVKLAFDSAVLPNQVYEIVVENLTDCFGNAIMLENSTNFGLVAEAALGDIVINEILFNPPPDGFDYVELYNNSDKIIDLNGWFIGHRNTNQPLDFIADSVRIVNERFSFFPNTYLVLTADIDWVINAFGECHDLNKKNFIEVALPGYNDEDGLVGIMRNDNQNELLDKVAYDADWQFELYDKLDGIALERIDPQGSSQNANNWHSASVAACNGTPTLENSQFVGNIGQSEDAFSVSPATFSPNGDDNDDFALINYQFERADFVLSVTIYDDNGRKIKRLTSSDVAGFSGQYKWDGLDDNGQKAPIGIYIVYAQAITLDGQTLTFKEPVVLGGAF